MKVNLQISLLKSKLLSKFSCLMTLHSFFYLPKYDEYDDDYDLDSLGKPVHALH
jgi:hypothetical protein